MTRDPRLLTIADVAERCGVSVKSVRRWIDRDELAVHRLPPGRAIRVSEADLALFLTQSRTGSIGVPHWPGCGRSSPSDAG